MRHLTLMIVASAVVLVSCHPLINPADPNSTTYLGVPILPDDGTGSGANLPDIVEWRSGIEHYLGQYLTLPIDPWDPGQTSLPFIEPRFTTSPLPENCAPYVVIVFSDSLVDYPDIRDAYLYITFNGHTMGAPPASAPGSQILMMSTYEVANNLFDMIQGRVYVSPDGSKVYFRYPANSGLFGTEQGGPDGTRYSVEFRNTEGKVIENGSREFAWLYGDVNSDGTVNALDDAAVGPYQGTLTDPSDRDSIRSDIDANGNVDGADQPTLSPGTITDVTQP